MKGWVCQSNAALMPGHRFTLGITCQAQPSQAQQCHPHPQARERLTHQEPPSPLTLCCHCSVCVSTSSHPAPTAPSFVSISAFRTTWGGNAVARGGFIPSSNSDTHHSTQMLLAASATEVFAGLKQACDSQLLTAAPKWQQRSDSSPLTAQACQLHLPQCTSGTHQFLPSLQPLSMTVKLKQAGKRKGLPSPAHRLGMDWFCVWAGILFIWVLFCLHGKLPFP